MNLAVETEQETDGRWIAEIPQIPGALAYGVDRREAISRVEALALRVLAARLENGEMPHEKRKHFSPCSYSAIHRVRILEHAGNARLPSVKGGSHL